nr:SpaA isopeptide-forming pilin-related protein [Clostridium perfringens]
MVLNDLAPGDYQFVEIEAPNGYELDKTPVKFTIVVAKEKLLKLKRLIF